MALYKNINSNQSAKTMDELTPRKLSNVEEETEVIPRKVHEKLLR